MNLLDQKLKDKLLLFNNIDKETFADTHSTHATSLKTRQNQINRTKTYEDKFSKLTNRQYDIIYSNFTNGNSSKPTPIQISALQNNLPVKEINNQQHKPSKESHLNNQLSRSKSKEKKLSNNVGERLYNYGFYIKNKIKEQRKNEDEEIHRQMTPKMSERSKKMIRESNVPVEERLYNLNKTTHSDIVSNDKNKECHTPKLNKKSLLMAEKLEPSSVRLLQKRKRNKINNQDISSHYHFYNYHNSNHNSTNNNNNSNSKISNTNNQDKSKSNNSTSPTAKNTNRFNELYAKGIETMHKKDQIYKEQRMKNEEEYKKFTYKPKITKNSPLIDNNIIRKDNITLSPMKGDEMYKKNCDWKRKLDKQNEKKKEIQEVELGKDCTFRPEIIQKTIQNDEKFIMKNINQMKRYVTQRRECIQMKKEYEEYKSKRLGSINNNTLLQPTVPKGFKLETENRSHSRENKTRRKENSAILLIKEQIEHKSNNSNVVPLYKQHNNNNLKFNGKYHNVPFDDQNDEQREMFINAVNALHYQIDTLKI